MKKQRHKINLVRKGMFREKQLKEFYTRLGERYPDLPEYELRQLSVVCAYMGFTDNVLFDLIDEKGAPFLTILYNYYEGIRQLILLGDEIQ